MTLTTCQSSEHKFTKPKWSYSTAEGDDDEYVAFSICHNCGSLLEIYKRGIAPRIIPPKIVVSTMPRKALGEKD